MATRAERAAEKVRKEKEKALELERLLKEKIAEQHAETRRAEAALREVTRKDDNKRRYHIGALAQEAGLFAWSNADWKAVCGVLARLADTPEPAAVLEGVLGENGEEFAPVDGYVADIPLSRRFASPVFSAPDEGETFESPPLETSEESDWKEATRKGPAAAKVVVKASA